MSNKIILKKSSVAGKIPTTGDLTYGEVALNYSDGKLYYKTDSNVIEYLANGGTFTNALTITDTTQSTSTVTGALVVAGGVGIGKNLVVGNDLFVGAGAAETSFLNPTIIAKEFGSNYVQAAIINSTATGSADWVAYGETGTDEQAWASVGFTGSGFTDPNFNITGNNDGYLFVQGTTATGSTGNLVLATGNKGELKDIVFATGGFSTSNEKMRLIDNTGQLYLQTDTDATSNTDGALRVLGGVSVGKSLVVNDNIYIGAEAWTLGLTNPTLVAADLGATYIQAALKNSGATGSADWTAYADNGSESNGWVDMGVTGSEFDDPNYTITGINDGYLFALGSASTGTGNLVLATGNLGSGKDIVFATGGFDAANEKVRLIDSTGQLYVKTTTTSVSTTTGALTVVGGVGIGGNLYVGGTINGNLAGTATIATNISGGTAGQLHYQSAPDTTGFVGPGTAGQLLVSAGTSAPVYTNTGSIYVSRAVLADTATTATSASTAYALASTGTTYVARAVLADSATNISVGSATQVLYKNASNITTGSSSLTFDGSNLSSPYLISTNSTGDEGGEILLAKPATNSTIAGTGVTVDIWQNRLRFFEQGGTARGFYIDITTGGSGVGTNLVGGGSVTSLTAGTDTAVNGTTGAITIWTTSTLQTVTSRGATTDQAISITNATTATATNTGALQVLGGAGIGSNLIAGGYGRFNGAFDEAASTTTVGLYVGVAGSAPSSPRVAFANSGTTWQIDNYNGNFRWYIPGTTRMQIDTTGTLSIYANVNATSTTTGALVVTGGVGIGSNLYVGGTIYGTVTTATTATSAATAYALASTGTTYVARAVLADSATTSTSAATAYALASTSTTYVGRAVLADSVGTLTNALVISNTTQATSTTTGALQVSGGVGVGGNAHIGGNIVVKNTAIVGDGTTSSVLTSAVTLDSFAAATYRSAQYIVSVSSAGLGEYQTSDVLVVHNGTNSFAQATSVFSGSKLIMAFSTTISGGNVLLQGTGSGTGANANVVRIQKTYITI